MIISKASVSGTGELLRDTLQESAAQMIRTLVPTVEQADLDRITRMLTTVTFAVFHDALTRDDQQFREAVEEFSDLVVAWMRARFPPADDPVWDGDDPVVTPLAPSPAASLRQDPPEGTRPDPTSR